MKDVKKNKIVILIGNKLWNWNTVLTFKKSNLNVVGVCIYENKILGIPFKFIFHSIRKRGIITVIDQILGRIFYKILNFYSDKKKLEKIFDIRECKNICRSKFVPFHYTKSYNSEKTISWIKQLSPDILVVHSEGWVNENVRKIPNKKIIIGGHPGITPYYRGAYSSFWALYNDDKDKIGYSIFHIDEGIDTGDLIFQEKINICNDDSYMSIDWKLMRQIAIKQVQIIEKYELNKIIEKTKYKEIPQHSEYPIPGLSHQLRFVVSRSNIM